MKRFSFPLVIFLLSTTFLQAQGWTFGDKVTIGHSWMIGNRPNNWEYKFHPSVQAGRNAVYQFSDNAAFGIGTFFSTEGGSFKSENNNDNTYEQRMNYIRIPLNVNFTFGDAATRVRPRIGLGGSVGFLVGGRSLFKNPNDELIGAKTKAIMETKVDAGATASLGLNVRLCDGVWLNHDINYYHGLVENKYDVDASLLDNAPIFTNRNIGLSMGFLVSGEAMRKWKNKMHENGGMKGKWRH